MKPNIREIAVFGMLTAMVFASKKLMEILPNIHLVGVLIIAMTVVYRKKALYPLYAYVFLDGIFAGFNTWWVPYLYIWTILWGAAMLLPKTISPKLQPIVYATLCALHGFLFGILYAPAWVLFAKLNWQATLIWLARGLPFDLTHGVSNFFCGLLIVPTISALRRVESYTAN